MQKVKTRYHSIEAEFHYYLLILSDVMGCRYTQRSKADAKQAFNPQITQITQIYKIIDKNNSQSTGFHDLANKN